MLRQPQGLGSPVSSTWDVLLLKPEVESLPHVQNSTQGNALPVATIVDASQNGSPRWSSSSHHCSLTTRWLAHMARI